MKNLVVTLNINYPKKITDLTFPFMQEYARNINADFKIIIERKYPELPIPMEKFQLYDICNNYEWIIFLDADVLINPKTINLTKTTFSDSIIIGEYIDLSMSQFVKLNILNQFNLNIHIPGYFLVFHKKNKKIFKMPKNPLELVCYIKNIYDLEHNNICTSWHLDEFIISLNASIDNIPAISLKSDLSNLNILAHIAKLSISRISQKEISIKEKVSFLKESIKKLQNMSNVQGEYS